MDRNTIYQLIKNATQQQAPVAQPAQPPTAPPSTQGGGAEPQQAPPGMSVPAGQGNTYVAQENRYNQTSGDMKKAMTAINNVNYNIQKRLQQNSLPQQQPQIRKYGAYQLYKEARGGRRMRTSKGGVETPEEFPKLTPDVDFGGAVPKPDLTTPEPAPVPKPDLTTPEPAPVPEPVKTAPEPAPVPEPTSAPEPTPAPEPARPTPEPAPEPTAPTTPTTPTNRGDSIRKWVLGSLGVGSVGGSAIYTANKVGETSEAVKKLAPKAEEVLDTAKTAIPEVKDSVIGAANQWKKNGEDFNNDMADLNRRAVELEEQAKSIFNPIQKTLENPGQLLRQWGRQAYNGVRDAMTGEIIPGIPNWGLAGGALGAYVLYNLFSGDDDDEDDEDWERRMRRMEEMLMMQRMSGR